MKKLTLITLIAITAFTLNINQAFAQSGPNTDCGTWNTNANQCLNQGNFVIAGATQCSNDPTTCCANANDCVNYTIKMENIVEGPKNDFFDSINPLKTENSPFAQQLSTPGGIVSRLLQFLFPLAGLALFIMIVWGGFEILSKSSQGTKGIEAGKNRITAALIGFALLFATYWMAQIIEAVFGIVIV